MTQSIAVNPSAISTEPHWLYYCTLLQQIQDFDESSLTRSSLLTALNDDALQSIRAVSYWCYCTSLLGNIAFLKKSVADSFCCSPTPNPGKDTAVLFPCSPPFRFLRDQCSCSALVRWSYMTVVYRVWSMHRNLGLHHCNTLGYCGVHRRATCESGGRCGYERLPF